MPNVLITGCSSGIGRALADAFKATGYRVWASARRAEDVAGLSAAGFNAVQLDVNDSTALQRLAEQLGELDVLVNNAGYGAMGPLLDGGTEAMQRQFETNVFSIVGVTQALFPALRRSKGCCGPQAMTKRSGIRGQNRQPWGGVRGSRQTAKSMSPLANKRAHSVEPVSITCSWICGCAKLKAGMA